MRRIMHSDAVCASIGQSAACEKGYHSRPLLFKSATVVAVDCDEHTLAQGLAIVVGSIVGKIVGCLHTFPSACRLKFTSTLIAIDALSGTKTDSVSRGP
jgi:hypothetical protein